MKIDKSYTVTPRKLEKFDILYPINKSNDTKEALVTSEASDQSFFRYIPFCGITKNGEKSLPNRAD